MAVDYAFADCTWVVVGAAYYEDFVGPAQKLVAVVVADTLEQLG